MAWHERYRIVARFVAIVLPAAAAIAASAQESTYDANEVKAAFLYHFGTYVQWPGAPEATDPITIVVLGDPAVAAQLARFLPGRRISGRPVQTRVIARIEELADDAILFIGRANNAGLASLTAAVAPRPVLVVTDAPDGLERGAMVNFREVDARVRFEISLPRAEEAGLVLSSRLLAAALRVEQGAQTERIGHAYLATNVNRRE
jgi:YfiR/HmsC-like